jgi:hypothetical protein
MSMKIRQTFSPKQVNPKGVGQRIGEMAKSIRQAGGKSKASAPGTERYWLIAQAAYFRAEKRGFTPGRELQDWLEAEAEIEQRLSQ